MRRRKFYAVSIKKLNYEIAQWKPKVKITKKSYLHNVAYSRKETESRSVP